MGASRKRRALADDQMVCWAPGTPGRLHGKVDMVRILRIKTLSFFSTFCAAMLSIAGFLHVAKMYIKCAPCAMSPAAHPD